MGKERKKLIIKGIFKLIGYLIGLMLFIPGCIAGIIPAIAVGLVLVGVQYGISFYKRGKRNEDNEAVAVYRVNSDGSYYRQGGWKKFVLALIGCLLGIILTPIDIIKTFKAACPRNGNIFGPHGFGLSDDDVTLDSYYKKLSKCIPSITRTDAGFFMLWTNITKKDMKMLIKGYPQNVDEVVSKVGSVDNVTCLAIASLKSDERKKFLENYPSNVESVEAKYPTLLRHEIVCAMCGNYFEKERDECYEEMVATAEEDN